MFVGMIWRETLDRIPAFTTACDFWFSMGADLRFYDSGHTPFNRAASRNLAVADAHRLGYRKLVITDADVVPELAPLTEAWAAVDGIHLPYTVCRVLNKFGAPVGDFSFTCGGTYVTTVEAWSVAGGQDERFTRWAPEDFAFMIANRTLGTPLVRHDGILLSLDHDRTEQESTSSDIALYRDYEAADGNPNIMRELCSLS